jgi:hypothetical protein
MICGILLQTLMLMGILYKTNWNKEVGNTYHFKTHVVFFLILNLSLVIELAWMNSQIVIDFYHLTLLNCRWIIQPRACSNGVDKPSKLTAMGWTSHRSWQDIGFCIKLHISPTSYLFLVQLGTMVTKVLFDHFAL